MVGTFCYAGCELGGFQMRSVSLSHRVCWTPISPNKGVASEESFVHLGPVIQLIGAMSIAIAIVSNCGRNASENQVGIGDEVKRQSTLPFPCLGALYNLPEGCGPSKAHR